MREKLIFKEFTVFDQYFSSSNKYIIYVDIFFYLFCKIKINLEKLVLSIVRHSPRSFILVLYLLVTYKLLLIV